MVQGYTKWYHIIQNNPSENSAHQFINYNVYGYLVTLATKCRWKSMLIILCPSVCLFANFWEHWWLE